MLGQDHIQYIRFIMEGNPKMTDQPFLLKGVGGFVCLASFEFLIVVFILRVHQIEIKVIHAAPGKLLFKKRTDILLLLEIRISQFIGQKKLTPVISFRHAVTDRRFRLPADIAVRRVKVIKPGFDKGICHPAKLLVIDLVAVHRQPHTTEAEIPVNLREEPTVLHISTS